MPRTPTALPVADVSAFAKALKRHIQTLSQTLPTPTVLTHAQWLNVLAAAAGYRNFATLKVSMAARETVAAQPSVALQAIEPLPDDAPSAMQNQQVAPLALSPFAQKALQQFDAQGRLMRLPTKYTVQRLACWVLWRRFEDDRVFVERDVNQQLNALHTFGDPATLRRELVNMNLLARKDDCSAYWKVAQPVPAEVADLFAALDQGRIASRKRMRGFPAASAAQAKLHAA